MFIDFQKTNEAGSDDDGAQGLRLCRQEMTLGRSYRRSVTSGDGVGGGTH